MPDTASSHRTQGAAELARQIAAGELTATEVVEAHILHIEQVNPKINALTQPRFDQARAEARRADEQLAGGEPIGPLHGVPVSIKDCFDLAGAETTIGILGRNKGPAERDSPLVCRLRAAGAIVLGKTNVPQGMLLHECDNPLHGRTTHPLDEGRSPGGSSGGEAALIAAGGSPLGLASDLGGSIRQPAAACGLCGFKPTSYRLTTVGSDRAISGMHAMPIAPGPIATRVEDLCLAMRVMLDPGETLPEEDERPAPWRDYQEVDVAKLRIAYWTDDGALPTTAAGVRRAVEQAAEKLTSLGADVRKVNPPATEEMLKIYFGLISADGMRSLGRAVAGGPVDPQIAQQLRLARLPRSLRKVLQPLMRLAGQGRTADLLRWSGPRTADEYWRLTTAAEQFRKNYWATLSGAYNAKGPASGAVDAVLSPPYGLPALRHGSALHLIMAASHCFLANLLDAPAGVVPAGTVTPDEEQQAFEEASPRTIGGRFARANARGSAGLPLAVQIMAAPSRDHVALGVLAALEPPVSA